MGGVLEAGKRVPLRLPASIQNFWDADQTVQTRSREVAMMELRIYVDHSTGERREELAIYSDDRPVEFWRQFPSFVEGPHLPPIV